MIYPPTKQDSEYLKIYEKFRKIQRNPVGETVKFTDSPAIDLCPECMNEFEKFMSVKFQEDKK